MKGLRRSPFRMYSAPTPFGAWILWPLTLIRSAEAFGREGELQKGLHRVTVQQSGGAGLAQQTGDAGNVRDGAGLVVDQHQA